MMMMAEVKVEMVLKGVVVMVKLANWAMALWSALNTQEPMKEYTSVSEINDSDIFPSNSNILPKKDFTHKLEGLSMLCFFWNVFGSLIPLIPTKLTQRGRQEYGAGITNIASPQNEVIRLCLCRTGPVLPPNLGWISFQTLLEWDGLPLNLRKINICML